MIEGDQETSFDADRIRAAGARAVQVNTGAGCHLDADDGAPRRSTTSTRPTAPCCSIENVGNLVCPALFDLGEHAKVVVISVTEGDDKPLKYPHMFAAADLVVVNKTDLLPYVDFDVDALADQARSLNPGVEVLPLVGAHRRAASTSGTTGSTAPRPDRGRSPAWSNRRSVRPASASRSCSTSSAQSARPRVMGRVEELLQCVMSLYGAGLERVLETVGADARSARLADDELVGNLLVLHDLHPDDVDTRVQRALDQVRPYLGSHAGGVSLSGVDEDGVVHLQLEGSCDGCPSSALTVKSAIEDAILVAAPDVVAVEAEGMVDDGAGAAADPAVPLASAQRSTARRRRLGAPRPRRAARDDGRTCTRATPRSSSPTSPAPWSPTSTAARSCVQPASRRDARRRRAHLRLRDVVRRAPRRPRRSSRATRTSRRCRCCPSTGRWKVAVPRRARRGPS